MQQSEKHFKRAANVFHTIQDQSVGEGELNKVSASSSFSGLSHAHIVRSYGTFFIDSTRSYGIVLEYMQRGSLYQLMKRGFIFDERALAVVAFSIIDALRTLQVHGIIHRDISVRVHGSLLQLRY